MDDKKEEVKEEKGAVKEEKVHAIKSWNQIRKESQKQARLDYAKKHGLLDEEKSEKKETASVETPPEKKVETSDTTNEKPQEPRIDPSEIAKKAAIAAAEETATKIAAETKESFKQEIQKILDKDKDIQDKQKEADELIAAWDKEKRLPKDYNELIAETMRIADAKVAQAQKAAERQRVIDEQAQKETQAKEAQGAKDTQQTKLDDYQKRIAADLEEIYAAGFLKRPVNVEEINNPTTTDEGAKKTQEIFDFGVKLNTERKTKGLPPVDSLNKIFFLHYQPYMKAQGKTQSKQVAGADAPVSPSRNQSVTQSNKPQPFYYKGTDGKMHPKSWAQIKYEMQRAKVSKV